MCVCVYYIVMYKIDLAGRLDFNPLKLLSLPGGVPMHVKNFWQKKPAFGLAGHKPRAGRTKPLTFSFPWFTLNFEGGRLTQIQGFSHHSESEELLRRCAYACIRHKECQCMLKISDKKNPPSDLRVASRERVGMSNEDMFVCSEQIFES